ncbi:MAG: WD40 repeat domain-containing protein, partial [Planctomycetes bacterium]|nr:WD40 repeat domain-containing protein [Planctomycetota bacterium]
AFDPASERIASAGTDGTVRLWNLPIETPWFDGDGLAVRGAVVSRDGRLVAAFGQRDGRPAIVIRDVRSGRSIAELLGHDGTVSAVAFSPDGKRLASASADGTARVWNLVDSGSPERWKGEHPGEVTSVVFGSDGNDLFTGSSDRVIRHWDLSTDAAGSEPRTMAGHTGPVTALATLGATLISASEDGTVRWWKSADGSAIRRVDHGAAVRDLAVSGDG